MNEQERQQNIQQLIDDVGYVSTSKDFIEEISIIYHNLESRFYDKRHPEIFSVLAPVYRRMLEKVELSNNMNVLDYGCGTGFEAAEISKFLYRKNISATIQCVDQNLKMLGICEKKLKKYVNIEYIIQKETYANLTGEYDLIITNSLVHHIYDVAGYLKKIGSLLKSNGYYLMVHEPNSSYYQNNNCVNAETELREYLSMSTIHQSLTKIRKLVKRIVQQKPNLISMLNKKMLKANRIKKGLSYFQVQGIVDIHVNHPFSDFNIGYNGFDIDSLSRMFKIPINVIDYYTYHYLGGCKRLPKYFMQKRNYLTEQFPLDGMNMAVLWKNDSN